MDNDDIKDSLLLSEKGTIQDALTKIEGTHSGFLFTFRGNNVINGVVTDGDIRRAFLAGAKLNDNVMSICSTEFIFARQTTPREKIIKQLENGVRAIPILNTKGHLVEVARKDSFSTPIEKPVFARSRAPARITFCGGGSDIHEHFVKHGGKTLNATINMYCHVVLQKLNDNSIRIISHDLSDELKFNSLEDLLKYKGRMSLITAVIAVLKPEFGFEMAIHSDFPFRSGLGGSAAVTCAILGCFNEFKQDKFNKIELAELSYQIERLIHGTSGGWQDQYAVTFGGINYQSYQLETNTVLPIRVPRETHLELEERLVLCFTNINRRTEEQSKNLKQTQQNKNHAENIIKNAELVEQMINAIIRQSWQEIGKIMDDGWKLKSQSNPLITNSAIDIIYNGAKKNGAAAGKLLGAGGGGFLLFITEPGQREKLVQHLESHNLKVLNFNFTEDGMESWTVRNSTSENLNTP